MNRSLWLPTLALAVMLLLDPAIARADCAPLPLSDQADRAHLIAYGTVIKVDMRDDETYSMVLLERVYKGEPPNPILVRGEYGRRMDTSVSYHLNEGTDHTLYLYIEQDGYYTTHACAGSHPGEPSAEETALLGEGQPAPRPVSEQEEAAEFRWRFWVPFIAVGVAAGAMGLVLLSIRRANARAK